MKASVATRDGTLIDLHDPKPSDFNIETIAAGLARAHRWGNQSDMTVAQHSVNVCAYVQREGVHRRVERAALMHDASEFLIADLSRPFKQLLPEYYVIENKMMKAIAERFDFDWPPPSIVKKADEVLMVTEARRFMHPNIAPFLSPDYGFPVNLDEFTLPVDLWYSDPLPPKEAADLFLMYAAAVGIF